MEGHLKLRLENIFVQAQESNASEYKERTKEVAHKVKHYGAFGEDYLGITRG